MYNFTGTIPKPFADASYRQFEVERYANTANEKYVSSELRLFGGKIIILVNAVQTQQITYRWTY